MKGGISTVIQRITLTAITRGWHLKGLFPEKKKVFNFSGNPADIAVRDTWNILEPQEKEGYLKYSAESQQKYQQNIPDFQQDLIFRTCCPNNVA